jgi:2-hydroxychromene-2-carboxylate isomerase
VRSKRPTFFFSLRSPYSWLAYHDLTTREPAAVAAVDWVPYWEPDAVTTGVLTGLGGEFLYSEMIKTKRLYVLQDVKRLAAARGFVPTWPLDDAPVWEVPHLAYLVAAGQGRGHDFIRAVHDARWQRGLDICAPATIARIGTDLGLDVGPLIDAPRDPAVREAGARALLRCFEAGVFGVPFLVHGRQKFWGLDRLGDFLATLPREQELVAAEPFAVSVPGPRFDDGHAGGCG